MRFFLGKQQKEKDTDILETTFLEGLLYTRAGSIVRRYWLTIAFVCGFLTDLLLLDRVDDVLDNIILLFYVLLAFSSQIGLYLGMANKVSDIWSLRLKVYAPLAIQYSFGGLLSGMFIFYGRSGDWLVSLPILVGFLVIMIANELVRDRAKRLIYHIVVLFIGFFAYMVLVIPVFIGQMGDLVFILSGTAALIVMYWFVLLLKQIIPRYIRLHMRGIVFGILSVYIGYMTLYFTNVIPPIPLSLQEIGIYHHVSRAQDGTYQLRYEPAPAWQFWRETDRTFSGQSAQAVYCFSNVFAPTRIQTTIFHRWEFRDDDGSWQEHARIPYEIRAVGHRGFRGFTLIQNFRDGEWRCSVETERGHVLGRYVFTIDTSVVPATLNSRID